MTKWFLEFFQAARTHAGNSAGEEWSFGLIAEVIERGWIVWVLKRMREAVDEKPKQWTELQAGLECLTQLLLLIEAMSVPSLSSPSSSAEMEAANTLLHQLIYNGQVLDIALDSIRAYKEGTQSLAYLRASVDLAWSLLRMLEKWGKGGGSGGKGKGEEMYVRKKKGKKRKGKGKGKEGEDGVPDEEMQEEEVEVVLETMFTFEAFEMVCGPPHYPSSACPFFSSLNTTRSIYPIEIRKLRNHVYSPCISIAVQGFRVLRKHEEDSESDTQASC